MPLRISAGGVAGVVKVVLEVVDGADEAGFLTQALNLTAPDARRLASQLREAADRSELGDRPTGEPIQS